MGLVPKWIRTIQTNNLNRAQAYIRWWTVYTDNKSMSARLLNWDKMPIEEMEVALKTLRLAHLETLVESIKYTTLLHNLGVIENLLYTWPIQREQKEFEEATKSLENLIAGLDLLIILRKTIAAKGE